MRCLFYFCNNYSLLSVFSMIDQNGGTVCYEEKDNN